LDSGYKVRGTVRSNDKGDYLKDLFKGKEFDYVIADDITNVSRIGLGQRSIPSKGRGEAVCGIGWMWWLVSTGLADISMQVGKRKDVGSTRDGSRKRATSTCTDNRTVSSMKRSKAFRPLRTLLRLSTST
jgi:hypothetical protein